jgi:hypothetical protein
MEGLNKELTSKLEESRCDMEGLNKEITSKLEESRELNERLVDMVGAVSHCTPYSDNHHRLIHSLLFI